MKDCKLVLSVKHDIVSFEGQDISMEELAAMAGFLQVFLGTEALKRGLDMEDVKDNMLDIHLAAMEELTEEAVRERKENSKKKKEDDTERKTAEC